MIYTTLHKTLKTNPTKITLGKLSRNMICFHYLANVIVVTANVSCFHSQCQLFSQPMSVVFTANVSCFHSQCLLSQYNKCIEHLHLFMKKCNESKMKYNYLFNSLFQQYLRYIAEWRYLFVCLCQQHCAVNNPIKRTNEIPHCRNSYKISYKTLESTKIGIPYTHKKSSWNL
jgi:hypothetical protein